MPFICLLTIWISSLCSVCPSFLLNFSIVLLAISNGFESCCFFKLLLFFIYSGYESFVENTYCNTLFQSVPFFFTLVMVYFDEKTFILKIYSDLLFFMVSHFCVYLMNLCLPNINVMVDFFPRIVYYFSWSIIAFWLPLWLSGKELNCQCRGFRFIPWVEKVPWRGKWQPTPVSLPWKSHGQRSLMGCIPWGHKRVRRDLVTKQQQYSVALVSAI